MVAYNIVKLDGGHAFGKEERAAAQSGRGMAHVTLLDQYGLATADLSAFNVLAVTDFVDQEYLFRHKQIIEDFLNQGRVVVAATHIFRPWLPGAGLFMPKKIKKHADYFVEPPHGDTFYRGIDMAELVYRKGVAGFYARGFHPVVNRDSEVVLRFADGTPVVFIDRSATKGTVVAGACRDFLSYGTGENSTRLLVPQFLQWLDGEIQRLQRRA